MQIPHRNLTTQCKCRIFFEFRLKKSKLFAKEGRHLSILRSKWSKIKFNVQNCAFNRRKILKRSAIKAQHILKTLVRNATSAMSENKKLKHNATFAIAEIAESALCASNCALPTSGILPFFSLKFSNFHLPRQ